MLKRTGAEDVRWDLSDLFESPTDPGLETALAHSLERSIAFEAKYKGKVATLQPNEFAAMMSELEADEDAAARPDDQLPPESSSPACWAWSELLGPGVGGAARQAW